MSARNDTGHPVERRRKKDAWSRLLALFNGISWFIIIGILIVTERAKPEFESFFDRFYQLNLRTSWDMEFVEYLLYLAIGGAVVCVIGLLLSLVRARRKTDGNRVPLLIMGVVSVCGMGGVLFFF